MLWWFIHAQVLSYYLIRLFTMLFECSYMLKTDELLLGGAAKCVTVQSFLHDFYMHAM